MIFEDADLEPTIQVGRGFKFQIPKHSMYGIFACMWPKLMVNVGKYSLHGACGIYFFHFHTWGKDPI